MRILLINPNSDPGMTAAIQESASAYAAGAFEVVTVSTPEAPRFLESYEDEITVRAGSDEDSPGERGGIRRLRHRLP